MLGAHIYTCVCLTDMGMETRLFLLPVIELYCMQYSQIISSPRHANREL